MFQRSGSDIVFSQYAQDPYEEFNEMLRCDRENANRMAKEKKTRPRRKDTVNKPNSTQSFVMSRHQRRGIKLIKISVMDLCNNSLGSDSDNETENVIISAQYIVKEVVDPIVDETESLVRKISKSLIEYSD